MPVDHWYLTDREIELLILIARGLSDREIGTFLALHTATVSSYVRDLLRKCSAANRTELVSRAFVSGILVPDTPGGPPAWSGTRTLGAPWKAS